MSINLVGNAIVSVLMIASNWKKFIIDAVESMINHTFSDFELLIMRMDCPASEIYC